MEITRSTLCFSLGIFLLLLNHANAESRTFPWNNTNLSPFQQWRSAYFCLYNTISPNICAQNETLTLTGLLSFKNNTEVENFCGGLCYNQTLNVLKCIDWVHRHFIFESGAPTKFVKDIIIKSCSSKQAFDTNYTNPDPNSATTLYGRSLLPLVSTMALIIATFSY